MNKNLNAEKDCAPRAIPRNAALCARTQASLAGKWQNILAMFLMVSALVTLLGMALRPSTPGRELSLSLLYFPVLVSFLTGLLNSILLQGVLRSLLQMIRGEKAAFADCFYFFRHHLRSAVTLRILIDLKLLLWWLPGVALAGLGALLSLWVGSHLPLFFFGAMGTLLAAGMVLVALLRYDLAAFCMADSPDCTPKEALRLSISLTDGRKRQLFLLILRTMGPALFVFIALRLAFPMLSSSPWRFALNMLLIPFQSYRYAAASHFYLAAQKVAAVKLHQMP